MPLRYAAVFLWPSPPLLSPITQASPVCIRWSFKLKSPRANSAQVTLSELSAFPHRLVPPLSARLPKCPPRQCVRHRDGDRPAHHRFPHQVSQPFCFQVDLRRPTHSLRLTAPSNPSFCRLYSGPASPRLQVRSFQPYSLRPRCACRACKAKLPSIVGRCPSLTTPRLSLPRHHLPLLSHLKPPYPQPTSQSQH